MFKIFFIIHVTRCQKKKVEYELNVFNQVLSKNYIFFLING